MNTKIHSLYWDNVDDRIPFYQNKVMNSQGLHINQYHLDKYDHADWIDWVLLKSRNDDIALIMDIDCIILNHMKVNHYLTLCKEGYLVGNAQHSDFSPRKIFAAPSFLAINCYVYKKLGRPSSKVTAQGDVSQHLTEIWLKNKLGVQLLMPSHAEIPFLSLPGTPYNYGIGTTFENCNYHLFESRQSSNVDKFIKRCEIKLNKGY